MFVLMLLVYKGFLPPLFYVLPQGQNRILPGGGRNLFAPPGFFSAPAKINPAHTTIPEPIFLGAQQFPIPRTLQFEPTYYLMNIVVALPTDRRGSPRIAAVHSFFITALFLQVPLSSIPTVFASLQAHAIARWYVFKVFFYAQRRSAGRATILAYNSQGMVLQSLQRPVRKASGSKFHTHFRANV